ncbi:NAD(P)H-dependent glycerol-3-phosphate dehydrogenase [Agrilactobacillus fermenti]|uniref:NAD(P)H-dependent glycerol-3-phosphate dehydrogenase n=1 Tax=Agrilactobacillus fermenti TaxID=2586909 RepID=UPI003A5C0A70
MTTKIAVLGSGSWGTVLGELLVKNGHEAVIWGRSEREIQQIQSEHQNTHYLPGIKLNPNLKATTDLESALQGAAAVLFVIPTKAIRHVAQQVAQVLHKQQQSPILISATKGLEQTTNERVSEVIASVIPRANYAGLVVLSGPSHAEEVVREDITTLTVASTDAASAQWVQSIFMNHYFRLYTNADVVGVEIGAALKNVIAIGAGALVGLDYGDNAKAALMTRGLAEMTRMGVALGAQPLTFSGLSALGDLIVTCTSPHSRNWRAGRSLGQGQSLEHILTTMGMAVEGVYTAKTVHDLSIARNIDMPISEAIYQVLYAHQNIQSVIAQMMQRHAKSENELMRTRN